MAETKTKKITLQFKTEGLDKVKNKMDSFSKPIALSVDDKTNKNLLKEREKIQKEIERVEKEDVSLEVLEKLEKRVETFRKKATRELIKGLKGAGELFAQTILDGLKEVEKAEKELDDVQEKRRKFDRKFDTGPEGDTIDPKGDAGRAELLEAGLRSLEKQNIITKEMTLFDKSRPYSGEKLLKINKEINENLEKRGTTLEKEIENYIKTGKVSKELEESINEMNKGRGRALTQEKALGILKATHLAQEEGKQVKINELKELETKETEAQAKLDLETKSLLKEKVDLLEEVRKKGTPEEIEQAEQLGEALDGVVDSARSKLDVDEKLTAEQKNNQKETKNTTKAVANQASTLGKAAKQVFNYGVAFSVLRRVYRETLRTIKELDKALTEMATVTTMSRKEAWALAGSMQAIAKETGFTATEVAKINTLFLRQGRSVSEAANLTRVAAQAARIASISGAESANFLTSAVNGFGLAASEVLAVSDRFAAIAANSASSYEELAIGLSKFAAQANVAGISMDFAMGLLAKGVETTREAPETIGTALKTVLARMRELTDFGKTLEDGMDISRVEGALRQVGIALRDQSGQFREMEDVLTDIGTRWGDFNREQQASIAVALAGTRQQSRLIAIMEDFDRTLELVNISQTAAGATNAQHTEFMRGLEAATAQMQNAYQQFITTITETETIIDIVRLLGEIIEFANHQFARLTDSGFNLTKVVVGLFVALKTFNTAIKLSTFLANKSALAFLFNIKTKIASTVATGKQIIAQNASTASTVANTAATVASTGALKAFTVAVWASTKALMSNPITLALVAIAAAITAVVFAFVKWRKTTVDLDEELKKTSNEIRAQNFEINRSVKNVNDLIEAIERLNKLPFLTKEQQSELEDLESRLIDIIGRDKFVSLDGIIDLDSDINQRVIEEFFRDQEEALRQGRRNLLQAVADQVVVQTFRTEIRDFGTYGKIEVEVEDDIIVEPLNTQQKAEVMNAIIQEFDDLFSDEGLTQNASTIYSNFLSDLLQTDPSFLDDLLKGEVELEEFVSQTAAGVITEINNITKALNVPGMTLEKQVNEFATIMSKLEPDEGIGKQLRAFFSDLEFISNLGLDEDNFKDLGKLGVKTAKDIQEAYEALGEDFQNVLLGIREQGKEIANLEGISEQAGIDLAFARAARAAEDATESAFLFGVAFRKTNLEVAQGLERIGSRIDNLERLRVGFREGTLSATELFDLVQGAADLFETESDVVRFLRGESIADKVFTDRANEEAQALSRIANAVEILNDETSTQIERNQALQDIAFFGAITRHTGDLSSLTQEQQRYNASLQRYELLAGLGVDVTDALNTVMNEQTIAMNQSANRTIQALERIEDRFENTAESVGITLGEGQDAFAFDDFFEVLEGVIVPKFDALDGLTGTALDFIQSIMSEYQDELNASFEQFQALRDRDLARQRENFDKQKKVYEDYFAALDRLEKQRERKVERQDLVTQLARLEGATDERSRRRALELRRELNELDEDTARDAQTQAREDLLAGFDERYAQLERQWADAALEFITEMSAGGRASGNAFITTVRGADLLGDVELVDVEGLGTKLTTFTNELVNLFGEGGSLADLFNSLPDRFFFGEPTPTPTPFGPGNLPPITGMIPGGGAGPGMMFAGYRKGGMVDHEGLAMLHGSKSSPEAVLSPSQTEMFIGLRNALEQINFDANGGGSINIEKIAISTASMNNNQDFKRAGETLADAFKNAIQRKGITLNTNKI